MSFIELAEAFYAACCAAKHDMSEPIASYIQCASDEVLVMLDVIVKEADREEATRLGFAADVNA